MSCRNSSNLFIVVHYTYQHMPHLLIIVDCTRVGSATASFNGLVTVAQENSTNQIADGGSATASFALGNHFPGVRTPET